MVTQLNALSARSLPLRPFRKCFNRNTHNSSRPPPLSFALDIDGVLLRGDSAIPPAIRALKILDGDNPWNAKIPFILMTNGGGVTEHLRTLTLSRLLNYPIQEDQLLQSHTILKSLTVHARNGQSRAHDHILVVGGVGDAVRTVAESYGFENVHTSLDILAWRPSIWPFHRLTDAERESTKQSNFTDISISSIFVFHDPRNWALDVQIMSDIIRSYPHGLGASYPAMGPAWKSSINGNRGVELFFCNPDLLWKAQHPVPRFGQGAFKEAFQAVFKAASGSTYPCTQFGKPHKLTYEYGKKMLDAQRKHLYNLAHDETAAIFMVGDNPESDIAGANAAGWKSFLVKTGVYHPVPAIPPSHKPTEIVPDIEVAVRRGIELVLQAETAQTA